MICFKDMAFCSAYPDKCKNDSCERALTEKQKESGKEWWGTYEFPVCFGDFFDDCSIKVSE